jgi:hypothetical protein
MIYPGTRTEQEYAHGRTDGRYAAEYVQENDLRAVISSDLADAKGNAHASYGRDSRAYFLGWLRGYREAVRTFDNGRWGT